MLSQIIGEVDLNFGAASYVSLVQAIVGLIASRLKIFNIDKATYKKSITEITEKGLEELSVILTDILRRKFETSVPMRGDPPYHEDILAKYQRLIFVKTRAFIELENDFKLFKLLNTIIFYISIAGLLLFGVASVFVVDIKFFLTLAIILTIVEIACICIMRVKAEKLDDF